MGNVHAFTVFSYIQFLTELERQTARGTTARCGLFGLFSFWGFFNHS